MLKQKNMKHGAAGLFFLFGLLFFVLIVRFLYIQITGVAGGEVLAAKIEKKYEKDIEMKIGGDLKNIVKEEEEDEKKEIEFIKTNKLGRATFLTISSVTGKGLDNGTLADISRRQGFFCVASCLVAYYLKYD